MYKRQPHIIILTFSSLLLCFCCRISLLVSKNKSTFNGVFYKNNNVSFLSKHMSYKVAFPSYRVFNFQISKINCIFTSNRLTLLKMFKCCSFIRFNHSRFISYFVGNTCFYFFSNFQISSVLYYYYGLYLIYASYETYYLY